MYIETTVWLGGISVVICLAKGYCGREAPVNKCPVGGAACS